jgi:hypothetical protein
MRWLVLLLTLILAGTAHAEVTSGTMMDLGSGVYRINMDDGSSTTIIDLGSGVYSIESERRERGRGICPDPYLVPAPSLYVPVAPDDPWYADPMD